jgi:glycosyltransferase involved in cell wall biosynthesis
MAPLLSIIVPVCKMAGKLNNLRAWLEYASIYDVEVWIIHDRQDDFTGDELVGLIQELNNPSIFFYEEYFGAPGLARNKGLKQAQGEWICFWDSDDIPNLISAVAVIQASAYESNVLVGEFQRKSEITGAILSKSNTSGVVDLGFDPGIWRFIFKRELIRDLSFGGMRLGEDQLFLTSLPFETLKIEFLKATLYTYFVGNNGHQSNNKKYVDDLLIGIESLSNRICKKGYFKEEITEIVLVNMILSALYRGRFKVRRSVLLSLFSIYLQISNQLRMRITKLVLSRITARINHHA